MANDLMWDHHFCLTCDKQTDGPAYCSESCRLADYEGATSFAPPSGPGSPSWVPSGSSTYRWAMGAAPSARSRQLFSLSPAYDFGNAQPYYGPSSNSSTGHYNYTRQPAPTTVTSPSSSSHYNTRHNNVYTSASASTLSLPPTTSSTTATTSVTYHHVLSPSSSHSSLSSMRSGMSSTGGGAMGALSAFTNGSSGSHAGSQITCGSASSNSSDLSEKVRSELRKYASSLEQGKLQRQLQRRRSC
ncbi:MAG: hypothetical protein STHCBS139747_003016 [Sporothrix thermara]